MLQVAGAGDPGLSDERILRIPLLRGRERFYMTLNVSYLLLLQKCTATSAVVGFIWLVLGLVGLQYCTPGLTEKRVVHAPKISKKLRKYMYI
jgi:hypothetical protein